MLRNTFCHLPGVGPRKERNLWKRGVLNWDQYTPVEGTNREQLYGELLRDSTHRLDAGDAGYFARRLSTPEQWRLFPDFRHTTAYLDIETNGLAGPRGYITAIAVYDGADVRTYVNGKNLDDFPADIGRFGVLVTYNGKCFDVPFIESYFGIRLDHAHIDLRFILKSLGFRGGLKGCEKQLGLDRGELDGVDGYFAVLLWEDYLRRSDQKVLDTLLAYNVLDTVNLERLMVEAFNRKILGTPFEETHALDLPDTPVLPYAADQGTVERLLGRYLAVRG